MIKPKVDPIDVKRKIEEALRRNAEVDANRIAVEANGSEVGSEGKRAFLAERH
jgi:osmotically-inducible protein OsmY